MRGKIELDVPERCRDCKHCLARVSIIGVKALDKWDKDEVVSYYCYFVPEWRLSMDNSGMVTAKKACAVTVPDYTTGTNSVERDAQVEVFDKKPSWCPIKKL